MEVRNLVSARCRPRPHNGSAGRCRRQFSGRGIAPISYRNFVGAAIRISPDPRLRPPVVARKQPPAASFVINPTVTVDGGRPQADEEKPS